MNPDGCSKRSGGGGGSSGSNARGADSSSAQDTPHPSTTSSSTPGSTTTTSSSGGTPPSTTSSSSGCPEFPESLPPLPPTLLAIENFYYTAIALSLPPKTDLNAFAHAAARFCAREWDDTLLVWRDGAADLTGDAAAHHLSQQKFLWRYCFGSALVWTLLHDVLRVPAAQPLLFANSMVQRDGAEVGLDWALGAALCTLMECTRDGSEGAAAGVVLSNNGVVGAGSDGAAGVRAAGGTAGWVHAVGRARLVLLGAALITAALLLAVAAAVRWSPSRRGSSSNLWLRSAANTSGSGGGLKEGGVRRPQSRDRMGMVNGSRRGGGGGSPPGSRRQLEVSVGGADGGVLSD